MYMYCMFLCIYLYIFFFYFYGIFSSFFQYCTLNILQLLLISICSYIYLFFATYTTRCAWRELQYFSLHCSNVFMIFSTLVFFCCTVISIRQGVGIFICFQFSYNILWISFSILPPVALVASTFVYILYVYTP